MTFTKCTAAQLPELQRISRETFADTFAEQNTPENMRAYMDAAFNSRTLLGELAEPASAFYLAWEGGAAAGYLKVNEAPAQTEINDPAALELERIYLRKERRGSGEGRHLLEYAVALAREKGKEYLWLGVWEKNSAALRFYRKHGFYAFSDHDFWMGDDRQRDLLMRLDLGDGSGGGTGSAQ